MSEPSTNTKARACRICLGAKCEKWTEIDGELSRLFEYCIGLPVKLDDAPKVFCGMCTEQLQNYAKFKERCLTSYNLWENIMCKTNCFAVCKSEDEMKEEILEEYLSDNVDDDCFIVDYSLGIENKVEIEEQPAPGFETSEIILENMNETKNTCAKSKLRKKKNTAKMKEIKLIEDIEQKEQITKLSKKELRKYFTRTKNRSGRNQWHCIKCDKRYRRDNCLLSHAKRCYGLNHLIVQTKPKKSVSSTFYCGLCNFKSEDIKTVQEHLNESCLNKLTCKLCDYSGRDVADMVFHRYKHYPSESKSCPKCDKWFLVALKLQFHYRSEHLNSPGGWCFTCGHTARSYRLFRNHVRLHKNPKYICDLCGMRFLYRHTIKDHLAERHYNIMNHVCETCGKRFKRKSNLKLHLETHLPAKPVVCKHCNKTYKNQFNLNSHMRDVKRGRNFICEICSNSFISAREMEKHMIWHTDERPFACGQCDAAYKVKNQLKIHMRSHTGYMPYQCAGCPKAFATGSQLKRHQSVHTGIRSVKCPHCDRTFYRRVLMEDHCKTKHKIIVKPEVSKNSNHFLS